MSKEKKARKKATALNKVPVVILSNTQDPSLPMLIQALYQAFRLGQLGLITGMDPDTGVVTPMLAGIELVDGEIKGVFPLAKLMSDPAEIERILIPDGEGNYVSNTSGFSELNDSGDGGETQEEGGPPVEQGATEAS